MTPAPDTRIRRRFASLRDAGRKGFIAFVTAGDPSPAATVEIVLRLEEAGVDAVELGIPFSDPLADGPVNQASAGRALAAGTTVGKVAEIVARIRARSDLPLLCYTYVNPLLAHGLEPTLARFARAGLDGMLILDLPLEEEGPYLPPLRANGLDNIRLVTPTSPAARVRRIVRTASGFVYCVSRAGVTGAQKALAAGAGDVVARVRRHTRLPVALGFGIDAPAQARDAAALADAIVVGSAIVSRVDEAARAGRGYRGVARWVRTLVDAIRKG